MCEVFSITIATKSDEVVVSRGRVEKNENIRVRGIVSSRSAGSGSARSRKEATGSDMPKIAIRPRIS